MDSPIGAAPARPWTPLDTEAESSPPSECFSDPFESNSNIQSWSRSSSTGLPILSPRCDTPNEDHSSRPKPISHLTYPTPYTPTKTFGLHNAPNAHGAPRYPYTPDSSRILRRSTELPSSPSPWEDDSDEVTSPIQNALSSCIAHIENLIQTREPDEDQMEYIVGQFEAMASYLAAPEAQSKTTDDHLFVEHTHGLGIKDAHNTYEDDTLEHSATSEPFDQSYVAQVGRYIQSVQKHVEDLKMRLDEAKTLNSIQLDVIDDLRRQMKSVRMGLQTELFIHPNEETGIPQCDPSPENNDKDDYEDQENDPFGHDSWETIDPIPTPQPRYSPPSPKYKLITIIRKPPRRSFWSSFAEALDDFGSLYMED